MKPCVSLTFDDGLDCQLKHAIPFMNMRHVKGTFFLAFACQEYPWFADDWFQVANTGHEIGSHSVTHAKAATLNPEQMRLQASNSKAGLEMVLQPHRVTTYCYPYTDAPATYQTAVRHTGYIAARGGRGAGHNKFITKEVNLFNVPCFHVGPGTVKDADSWAQLTLENGAWLTLMLHGVGEEGTWDNISIDQFNSLLDSFQRRGIDFVTFAQGAERYRKANSL